jgi:hypothetical protein
MGTPIRSLNSGASTRYASRPKQILPKSGCVFVNAPQFFGSNASDSGREIAMDHDLVLSSDRGKRSWCGRRTFHIRLRKTHGFSAELPGLT